jgi:hypothetical protein
MGTHANFNAELDAARAFVTQVGQLQTAATQANPDGRSLQSIFLSLQQAAQQGLLAFTGEGLSASDRAQLLSHQTEISRALRLLGIDISFLQAARQAITTQKRQAQMGDRLEQLIGHGEGIVAILQGAADGCERSDGGRV